MNEWLAMNEQAGQGREQRFSTTDHVVRRKKVCRTGGTEGGGRGLRTRICIDMGSQCGGFLEGGVGASANLRVCGGVAGCLWLGCTAPRWRCRFFP